MDLHLSAAAARLAAWVVVLSSGAALAGGLSPGDLARKHSMLEGISNCTKCHPGGDQLSPALCFDCHAPIGRRTNQGVGLHGRLPANQKEACQSCHHDHQGLDFDLVGWAKKGGEKGFDHKRTGWPLYGKHGPPLKCEKCHEVRLVKDPAVVALIQKEKKKSYLGMARECSACHFDEHRGQVANECEKCHDENDWKKTPGFNHQESNYPLTGLHKKVKCEACHPKQSDSQAGVFPAPVSETFLKLAPLEFKRCTDCHKDFHEGKFGQRCTSCHSTAGWRIIRDAAAERGFHEKARFKLRGDHVDVECASCHGPFPGRPAKFKGLAFEKCSDCHPDGHFGQLSKLKGEKVAECDRCHTVEGFNQPKYGPEEHAKTKYPLEGGHLAASCGACHPASPQTFDKALQVLAAQQRKLKREPIASPAKFDLGPKTDKCDTCHQDVHNKQFKVACDNCHQVSSFHQTKFDHQKDSRFPLLGKHLKARCDACHQPSGAKAVVSYRGLPMECSGCHEDEHVGQLAQTPGSPTKCDSCHGNDDWKKTTFKHEPPATDFLLEGMHAKVECKACHLEVTVAKSRKTRRYRPLPKACEGCHSDFHHGAFKGFTP